MIIIIAKHQKRQLYPNIIYEKLMRVRIRVQRHSADQLVKS